MNANRIIPALAFAVVFGLVFGLLVDPFAGIGGAVAGAAVWLLLSRIVPRR